MTLHQLSNPRLLILGILTLLVPQAQVTRDEARIGDHAWQMVQVRLLAVFTALNVISFVLIFCLVPDTSGATVGRMEGRIDYMSLEDLNFIFMQKTRKHVKDGWQSLKSIFTISHPKTSRIRQNYEEGNNLNGRSIGLANRVSGDETRSTDISAQISEESTDTTPVQQPETVAQRPLTVHLQVTEANIGDAILPQHYYESRVLNSNDQVLSSGGSQIDRDINHILEMSRDLNNLICNLRIRHSNVVRETE